MGKGDQKSKRGKIAVGSFGNARPRKKTVAYVAGAATAPKKAAKKAVK